MERIQHFFKEKNSTETLKLCKLALNSTKVDPTLEQLAIEIWNTAIKQNLDARFKLCAFILFLKCYENKNDSKTQLKVISIASRMINELDADEKEFVQMSCADKVTHLFGVLSSNSIHKDACDQMIPLILSKLEQEWQTDHLSVSISLFQKLVLLDISKTTINHIFTFIFYLYEHTPLVNQSSLTFLTILEVFAPKIHTNKTTLSNFYLLLAQISLEMNETSNASNYLTQSSDYQITLGTVATSIKIPLYINIPVEQFVFECLSSIAMKNEQYTNILSIYDHLVSISLKSANSFLESILNKCRKHPTKSHSIIHKCSILYFQSLIEINDTSQIQLFIDDILENINQTSLTNSVCVLLWIKGDSLINEMDYKTALLFFEPSSRLITQDNENWIVLKRKISFCKLQLNQLNKVDLTDDPFLQFQYYICNDISKCEDILMQLVDSKSSAIIIGCASLAFQKQKSDILLSALSKLHLCGPVELCLTRAAIRLALKTNAPVSLILTIVEKLEKVDHEQWFFNVIWNICLKHHEQDKVSCFKLLKLNLKYAPDIDLKINNLLFLCSIGCDLKLNNTNNLDCLIDYIEETCQLIAIHEKKDLIAIAAQMEFQIFCFFQQYDKAIASSANFNYIPDSPIVLSILEHAEELRLPLAGMMYSCSLRSFVCQFIR